MMFHVDLHLFLKYDKKQVLIWFSVFLFFIAARGIVGSSQPGVLFFLSKHMIMNQDRLKMLFSNLRQMRGGHEARRQQSLKWTPHHIGSHEVFCVEIPTTRPVSQIKMLMIRHWLKEEKYAKDWGIPGFSIWWKWQEVT